LATSVIDSPIFSSEETYQYKLLVGLLHEAQNQGESTSHGSSREDLFAYAVEAFLRDISLTHLTNNTNDDRLLHLERDEK
jgi:hypothetical protein